MNFALFLISFILISQASSSMPRHDNLLYLNGPLCGNKLADAMSAVCRGRYYSPSKKSAYEPDENFLEAYSLVPLKYRRAGIVDECCRKPCTVLQMLAYCES